MLIHFDQQQLILSIFFMNLKKRLCETESLAISKPSPAKGRFLDQVINQSTAPAVREGKQHKFLMFQSK